ncbi:DEAD/DEAH box helicase [Methanohalophilus portucalensis]|uniref:RNA helicase n=2 Tax=Methanohalophilus portucalensis TaxID=39664 RepID=A0A1L9C2K7_9EURY|nr:DEAD/DEAH box helicase [Methanohalophilus portucalensis]ATU08042.1 ATP-dependent RNA helicase [Methanohalophilus portucalensis]OJH48755.1 DEAD/DEAH box helicase [Methanohalophilus portucalensis FDF-1]RNI12236.1 DEAD/DEAH box helicase [Methanohalophilus portucalensis FDF-1]SMH43245.1 ATP-dependent RNA helicase DeaD [Methanohalophilus portucalensis FDF-1]
MESLTFKDLNLSKNIERAVEDMGFEEPTPIQSQSIPYLMEGKDVIGQAQTGTGKTAAFGIPALEMLDVKSKKVQVVVLCPTRELANQVAEEMSKLAKYQNTKMLPVYGGQPIDRQIKALRRGVHIVIGTPGRVMDHIQRKTLKLDGVKMLVLDEADEMLDMGFREDIEFILSRVPGQKQTVLFSATMPQPIIKLTKKYQQNPQMVKTVHKKLTVPQIEQFYFEVKNNAKTEVLCRLIDIYNFKSSLVFCNTKKNVDKQVETLKARGYLADGMHGDMRQAQRERVMANFRKGEIETLVATDVAARGIDVENIEAVFNYDIPQDEESYVHRIGRTGRAGKEGVAITFASGKDIRKIKDIQKHTKAKITRKNVPSQSDVEDIRAEMLSQNVKKIIDDGHIGKYEHWVENLLEEDYASVDVAAALVKILLAEEKK